MTILVGAGCLLLGTCIGLALCALRRRVHFHGDLDIE